MKKSEQVRICERLGVDDFHYVEIESKKRVLPEDAEDLRDWLADKKKVKHEGLKSFFDQFLDTPSLDLLKAGASLRLRYKGDGTNVYLQYKGPGFHRDGLLFRSEFSSPKLEHVILEQSHHDVVHFTQTTIHEILSERVDPAMLRAMVLHLGARVVRCISMGPIVCLYQKDKFEVDLGSAFLEPSLDRLFAFHINRKGLHPMSTFCEYENEIKSESKDLGDKLDHLDELLDFDEDVADEFDLKTERLDKYHRCASTFVRHRR